MEDPALYPDTLTGYPVASQRISNALVGEFERFSQPLLPKLTILGSSRTECRTSADGMVCRTASHGINLVVSYQRAYLINADRLAQSS
jgi:hypothetical protein